MIAVCITTYNHESFIAKAIKSVLTQECDEPVRLYIGDDASEDGTSEICRRYAEEASNIVYVKRQNNIGLVPNTIDLYRRIMADGGDYIAMLDGDDYWTDNRKLQIQVNYLNEHPDVGFTHTGGNTLSGGNKWTFGQREGVYGLHSVGFANCTVLFRTSLLSEKLLSEIESQHLVWLDYPLYGVFYQETKWKYLPQKTAIWRDHTSLSQPKTAEEILQLREERCRMWKWLDELYPGKVGYSAQEAQDFLFEERLNLIYQFNDRSLITPVLFDTYRPHKWKQRLKLKGLKNIVLYTILQKISFFVCTCRKNIVPL